MATATLTSKGQMTVPKEIRDLLGLESGDRIDLVPDGNGSVAMRKAPIRSVTDLFGRFPTNGVRTAGEDLKDVAREAAAEHVVRRGGGGGGSGALRR
jgi:AbrB family looped-hinge helix DNA binding protein